MSLVSDAGAFNLCVEPMGLAHVRDGNLVSGFGRCFLKARLQGLACLGEQHVLLESKTVLSLFYAFCDKRNAKEILKVPDSKRLESAGHFWETLYLFLHPKGTVAFPGISLCRKTASVFLSVASAVWR